MQGYGYGQMPGYGYGGPMHGYGDGYARYGNGGFDLGSLFYGLLNFAVSILSLVLIIAVIVGIVVLIKRYLLQNDIDLNTLFVAKPRVVCTKCHTDFKGDWGYCPKCGQAKPGQHTSA